ncbi:MAG: hypothetical protein QOI63_417, partial [Thermoplasmata archaeon]|nr:hypothetical protein [Thermoplasmata archaeon]
VDNLRRKKPRLSVAFAEARHASELAAKALLCRAVGDCPRKHEVAPHLYRAGVMPKELVPRQVDRLLRSFTRGEYGTMGIPSAEEVEELVGLATTLVAAAQAWPKGRFHKPVEN